MAAEQHGGKVEAEQSVGRKSVREPPRNKAGRPTAADLLQRKAKVIEVATEQFVLHGYAATSLVDIARLAGVATRTLYQHFGDKEALFRDVIVARDTGPFFKRPVVERADTLTAALMRTARYTVDATFHQHSIDLMRVMIAESKRFPDLTRQIANATFSRFRRNVAGVFEALASAGLIPAGDHALSAALFIDLVLGGAPIMAYTDWSAAAPTDKELRVKVGLFIRGRFGEVPARRG